MNIVTSLTGCGFVVLGLLATNTSFAGEGRDVLERQPGQQSFAHHQKESARANNATETSETHRIFIRDVKSNRNSNAQGDTDTIISGVSATPIVSVPEPGTMILLSLGLAGIVLIRRLRG